MKIDLGYRFDRFDSSFDGNSPRSPLSRDTHLHTLSLGLGVRLDKLTDYLGGLAS